jgi:hypothetical protein
LRNTLPEESRSIFDSGFFHFLQSHEFALLSISALRYISLESIDLCSIFLIGPVRMRGRSPSHDSSVMTLVVSPIDSCLQTWIALIPSVEPVQAIIWGLFNCKIVELIVPGPAFQLNFDPTASGPCKEAALISGFQSGHRSMAANTSQTTSALAATVISPVAVTGALRFIFKFVSIMAISSRNDLLLTVALSQPE